MTANQDRSRVEIFRRRDVPTAGSGVIRIGDMVIADGSGNATVATGTDDAVADALLGVSLHAKPTGETPTIAVVADGVFEMDLASGLSVALKVGDPVEFDDANSNAQTVKSGSTNPIGKVYRACPVGAVTVMVHIIGRDVRIPVVAD